MILLCKEWFYFIVMVILLLRNDHGLCRCSCSGSMPEWLLYFCFRILDRVHIIHMYIIHWKSYWCTYDLLWYFTRIISQQWQCWNRMTRRNTEEVFTKKRMTLLYLDCVLIFYRLCILSCYYFNTSLYYCKSLLKFNLLFFKFNTYW